MGKLLFMTTITFILCSNLFASGPLTFSKDSIIAFDGKFWNYGSHDDSIEIKNVTSEKSVIDSINIDLQESDYPEYQIGWVVKTANKDSQYVQVFNSEHKLYQQDCQIKNAITLTEYSNLPDKDKLSIGPNSSIIIQSPYVSTQCTGAGIYVYITGPYPYVEIINQASTGKISFFSDNTEYSVYLNVIFYKWPTSVTRQNQKEHQQANIRTPQKTISLLGRTYSRGSKLLLHKTLDAKKKNNTVQIIK